MKVIVVYYIYYCLFLFINFKILLDENNDDISFKNKTPEQTTTENDIKPMDIKPLSTLPGPEFESDDVCIIIEDEDFEIPPNKNLGIYFFYILSL